MVMALAYCAGDKFARRRWVAMFPFTLALILIPIGFGLSMDYQVFLLSRVLEQRRRELTERAAVIEGLSGTAGLSAAAIVIGVFATFMLGNRPIIKMLGFTLAVAVLIDATAVRMVIGLVLLRVAGDWNSCPLGLSGSQRIAPPEAAK